MTQGWACTGKVTSGVSGWRPPSTSQGERLQEKPDLLTPSSWSSSPKNCQKMNFWGFPGSSVVRNQPANAEDTGLIPDLRRSHMPQSNYPMHHNSSVCALEPGSRNCCRLCALESMLCNKRSHHHEKLAHHN